MNKLVCSICFLMVNALCVCGQQQNDKCDFSKYKPSIRSFVRALPVLKKETPQYPRLAMEAHVSGAVMVMILIDQEGDVARACADNGHPLLRQSAVKAALQWKFDWNCKSCAKHLQQWIVFNFRP